MFTNARPGYLAGIAVVVFLGILWNCDPIRDRDAQIESAYHAVIGTVVLFLLGLRVAVLFALTSQLRPDIVRAVAHAKRG